ncbi:MAG: hypothetical protein P8008_08090 [Gammaproteobacteria bacterium]
MMMMMKVRPLSRNLQTVLLLLGLVMITMASAMDAAQRDAAAGAAEHHAEASPHAGPPRGDAPAVRRAGTG